MNPRKYRNPRNSTLYLIVEKILQKLDLLLFYLTKSFLKNFGHCVEIWCNFLNIAILVFLAFQILDVDID
jgi:hypothetical protein